MKFTDNFIQAIREIRESVDERGVDVLRLDLRRVCAEFDVTPAELLHLALDKDYLQREIQKVTELMDVTINEKKELLLGLVDMQFDPGIIANICMLKEELEQSKIQKYEMGLLICELHGHTLYDVDSDNQAMCKNCGVTFELDDEQLNKKEKYKSKNIVFTTELIQAIKEIRESVEERGVDVLRLDLRMKCAEFDVTPAELLHFALDKNCLQEKTKEMDMVAEKKIDILIELEEKGFNPKTIAEMHMIKDGLEDYRVQKSAINLLICELHGHDLYGETEDGYVTCRSCGKVFSLKEDKLTRQAESHPIYKIKEKR